MFPWQVGGRERTPDTLLWENRARWKTGRCHLERFRGDSVPGGRQEVTPGTLLRGFRARWTAGKDTWNAFAGIPCQVEAGRCHLEHFRKDTVAGGRQEVLPGTLSREFRARWTAGSDTWNTLAGKPCQVDGRKGHLERFRGDSVPGGLPIGRDILWHSAGPSHNAGPFPSREPMPASASVYP